MSNRLSSSVVPSPVVIGLTPRWRNPTNAAPISPNTAPEAPPWNSFGCSSSAPAEPPSRAAKYSRANRIRPIAGSSSWPSWNSNSMLNAMWMIPKCRNPDVTSRYHSPRSTSGSASPSSNWPSVISRVPVRLAGSWKASQANTPRLIAIRA